MVRPSRTRARSSVDETSTRRDCSTFTSGPTDGRGTESPRTITTIVAFGAGFTSGGVTIEWTADPARGLAGEAAVDPDDVHVRLPVDWDSVDPIPPALAALMAKPGPVNPPLDDVVPGEPPLPEPAR